MATTRGVVPFDVIVRQAPTRPVRFTVGCSTNGGASLDLITTFVGDALGRKQTVKVPLTRFGKLGADLTGVGTPLSISADAPFAAAFTHTGGGRCHRWSGGGEVRPVMPARFAAALPRGATDAVQVAIARRLRRLAVPSGSSTRRHTNP